MSALFCSDIADRSRYEEIPGFGPTGQIERLQYPLEVVDRLITSLKESTTLYPAGRRKMGEFDVGFLLRV